MSLWPSCEFDDCESGHPAAMALVPMVSANSAEPYAWVLSCAGCLATAGVAARVDDRLALVRHDALLRLAGEVR